MYSLIDANIVLRYLNGDGWELYDKSRKIIESLDSGELQWVIPEYIIMEILFVMTWYYEISKWNIASDMRKIMNMYWIVNDNKAEIIEALSIYEFENVDFADALLVAKYRFQDTNVLSFDKKINKLISQS